MASGLLKGILRSRKRGIRRMATQTGNRASRAGDIRGGQGTRPPTTVTHKNTHTHLLVQAALADAACARQGDGRAGGTTRVAAA